MKKFMNFSANVQNVFNNDENDFLAFSQLLTDTALGTQKVSNEEANAKIVEVFQGILGIDKDSKSGDVRRAIRRNQALVFDIIEETVQNLLVSGWGNDPFFQKYVDQRNLALGDKNAFEIEDESILSVMKVSGNHHDIARSRLGAGSVQSIATYWVACKVYAEMERVVTGVEDFAKLANKIYEAYDRYVKDTIYDTFCDLTNVANAFKGTGDLTDSGNGATGNAFRALCEKVETATGCPVVIMGTRTALRQLKNLQDANYISNEMKSEYNRTGLLLNWEGREAVEIPQVFEKNKVGTYKLDNKKLFIMPVTDMKFIKVVNEGDTQMHQVTDSGTHTDMTYDQEIQTKLGVAILLNSAFGVWTTAN